MQVRIARPIGFYGRGSIERLRGQGIFSIFSRLFTRFLPIIGKNVIKTSARVLSRNPRITKPVVKKIGKSIVKNLAKTAFEGVGGQTSKPKKKKTVPRKYVKSKYKLVP